MTKYIVWNTANDDRFCFDTRTSAEEFILSIAEENDFEEFNYGINRCDDADTFEEYVEAFHNWLHKEHCSNECICLYVGGYNFYIREIPYLED